MASRTAAVASPMSVACSYTGVSTTPVGTCRRSCVERGGERRVERDHVAADAPRDVDHRRGAARRAHQQARIGVPFDTIVATSPRRTGARSLPPTTKSPRRCSVGATPVTTIA